VASLPEFLREGSAVDDTINADRVVIGAVEEWAIERLVSLHKPIGGERIIVAPESAQMAKYAANAYLALRITFINQIADLCEKTGANVEDVIHAIGYDKRIGTHYWYPGLGYGGSCFPKDVKELAAVSKKLGFKNNLLVEMDEINEARIVQKMDEYETSVGGFKGKMVAVLGLSFKPNTTDMRVAPSLKVIPYLKEKKAVVKAFDPKANDEAKKIWPAIFYGNTLEETIHEAEVIILLVEWDEFREMDLQQLSSRTAKGAWIIDTRNMLNKNEVEAAGLRYKGIGTI
jgi:UDPglucose 6-dehydrogenase